MRSAARVLPAAVLAFPLFFSIAAKAQEGELPNAPDPQSKNVQTVSTVRESSNWQQVQSLPQDTTVTVKAASRSMSCALKGVNAESLDCARGKDITFQRTDIRLIRIPHRSRSALVGAAVGAGAGAAVGAAISRSWWAQKSKGIPVGMAIFTPIGLAIGASTDFTRATVYRSR